MQNAKIKNQNDNVKCKMIKNSNSKSQIPNKFKIKIFKIQKFAKQIFYRPRRKLALTSSAVNARL